MHTTNYYNTFIHVADDCPVYAGEIPPLKGDKKTIANLQFEMLRDNPYTYTSDEVIFGVYAERNDISEAEYKEEMEQFFSKGQACLRSSPLTKRYGWGVHANENGKVALYPLGSDEYDSFANNPDLTQVMAMRSKRK